MGGKQIKPGRLAHFLALMFKGDQKKRGQRHAFPGGENSESMTLSAAAYILSAVIGVIVCGGLLYFVGKKVAKD